MGPANDDALRVLAGEAAHPAVDDQMHRPGDHLAEEGAVDRRDVTPVDGGVPDVADQLLQHVLQRHDAAIAAVKLALYGMTEGGGTCILEAHLHPGKLFKESSGRMLRWNVMR